MNVGLFNKNEKNFWEKDRRSQGRQELRSSFSGGSYEIGGRILTNEMIFLIKIG